MKRRIVVLGSAALAAIGLFVSAGGAYANTVFDTGMVTVMAETRAVKLGVAGVTVLSVNKVSDPGVEVRVTADESMMPVATSVHAAGENGCSAADDIAHGTLNRTLMVQGGTWATIYIKVQYTSTTPLGISTQRVIEPLGADGMTVSGPALIVGVPVDICVA